MGTNYAGMHFLMIKGFQPSSYGAIATDGRRRFFRMYDKFDGPTFLKYLEAAQSLERSW